jgi:hypothetical protein
MTTPLASHALDEGDYYDYHDVLTYNAPWTFIIGARGLGKTYGAKKLCIRDFVKNGAQFIYLRRTDVEQKSKGTFFADIGEAFPDYEFRVNGAQAECHYIKDAAKTWHIMGYFIALSQAGGKKSIPYPNVRNIIYDEVFPDNQQFLSNEVTALEEFYNTVDRWKDKVRLFFLSNAVIKANPYFAKFHISLDEQQHDRQEIKAYGGGFIVIQLADYGGFSAKVERSRFGKFLRQYDSDYADYAINNKFRDDSSTLIMPLDSDEDGYSYTLDTEDYGKFGVWYHLDEDYQGFLISRRIKRGTQTEYTLDYRHVSETMVYIKRGDPVAQRLANDYRRGRIRFDDTQTKADFSMVIGSMLGK